MKEISTEQLRVLKVLGQTHLVISKDRITVFDTLWDAETYALSPEEIIDIAAELERREAYERAKNEANRSRAANDAKLDRLLEDDTAELDRREATVKESLTVEAVTEEWVCKESADGGRYWQRWHTLLVTVGGKNANDYPVGTRLRVTAQVVEGGSDE